MTTFESVTCLHGSEEEIPPGNFDNIFWSCEIPLTSMTKVYYSVNGND